MKVGKKALSLLLTVSMVFSFVPNSLTFATAKGSTENTYADSAYDSGGKKDSGIPGPSVPVTGIQLSKTNLTLEYGESETLTATVSPEEANDQEIFWITSSSKICTVDQNGKVTAKGNGTATITAITHDGGFTAECKVTVITSVTGVELDKTTMTLAKGTKEALTAIITPQSATQKGVLWSSSDQNVCTVDSSGNVTALNTGTAIVTATTKDGGLTAECTVTVVIPAYRVSLNKNELMLEKGKSEILTATVSPADATNKSIAWSCSNNEVCTVDQNGKVTAIATGTATITVKTIGGEFTAECKVTVVTPVTGIKLNKTSASLAKGGKETLTATVTPEDASQKEVIWSSSDENICTVDASGVVTAINEGTAVVLATTKDGRYTATCIITVTVPITGIALDKPELTLEKGQSESLTATISPADATNKSILWSTSDESVAYVDQDGKVTAMAAGTAIIKVTTRDGISAQCAVTVYNPVTSIKLSSSELTLAEGKNKTLTATIYPEDAANKTVTWSSSNEEVAYVTQAGKVIALSIGTATITATAKNGVSAQCAVTVVIPATSIKLSSSTLTLTQGKNETLTATVYPEDATDKTVTWSSSNEDIVYVTQSGKVIPLGVGNVIITATTKDGVSAQCAVTVIIPAESIKLSSSELTLAEGKSASVTATVYPEDAADKTITWSSSDEEVAYVTQFGKVIALSAGTATVTAATKNGVTAQCSVTVIISVTGIKLSSSELALTQGKSDTLTATVYPENATVKTVLWSSSNEDVAYVTQSGKVIALGVGTATITAATKDGNFTAEAAVTVKPNTYKVVAKAIHGFVRGTGTYNAGSKVTLTAVPDRHYHFINWVDETGNTIGTETTYEINELCADTTVSAVFAIDSVTVTATAGPNGTVSGSGEYQYGDTVTLTATPDEHYHFTGWSDGVTTATRTFTAEQNIEVTAAFAINTITVTATAGPNGTVSGGSEYQYGDAVTLTATPDEHYHFTGWSDGVTTATRTFTAAQNVTLTARFSIDTFAVTATAGAGGSTTGGGTYEYGKTVTLTAVPSAHYHFTGWSDGITIESRSVTVTKDMAITASFAIDTFTVTVIAGEGGTVTGGGTYPYGTWITLNAIPYGGYKFVQWSDGYTNASRAFSLTSDTTYFAQFDKLYDATIQILGKHDTQCIIKDSVINPDGSGWLKMANYDTEWYRDLIGLDIKLDNPVLVSNNDYFWNAPNLSFSAEHANLQYCHSSGYYNDTLVFNDSYNGYHNYYGIAQIGSSPILTNHVRIWWDVKVSASSSYDGFYYISWPAGGLTVLGTTIKSPKILPIIYL